MNNIEKKTTKKGKLIVLEGIDGSGKRTQLKLLARRLRQLGFLVKTFDFPRYGQISARLVEDYLMGKFGPAGEVNPYQASLLYALDRFAAKRVIEKSLRQGAIVLVNRYVTANEGHQGGKIKDRRARRKFLRWLNNLEYKIFGLPQPTLVIFLDIPPAVAQELILSKGERKYLRGKRRDQHEQDITHLQAAYQVFQELLAKRQNWRGVKCIQEKRLLSRPAIHQKVWSVVKKII